MKQKVPVFLEYIWLITAFLSLLMAIYQWCKSGVFTHGGSFFIICILSIFMFLYRRYFRKTENSKTD